MSYYLYYSELKNRLFLVLLTWSSVNIVCFAYKELLIFSIIDITDYTGFLKTNPYFVFSNVTDLFNAYIQLSFFVSNQVCFFFIFYQLFLFVAPGLYVFEYKNFIFVIQILFFGWIFSVLVLNYVILPISWTFFLSFNQEASLISFIFEANLKKYLSYYFNLYYLCVLNFQIFFIILFSINNISHNKHKIKSFRKWFYFLFVFFSTVSTPPDIFSQLVLSLSFIIVYELFILYKFLNINWVTN
jgi:sec-independent protein translocase protein TatC